MSERLPLILVVSQEPLFKKRAAEFFLADGYAVQTAETGMRAIATVIDQGAEAVLIQSGLVGLSVYDTALIIKKLDPRVRVIIVLDDEKELQVEETKQVDFFEYFLEPLNLRTVSELLRGNRI